VKLYIIDTVETFSNRYAIRCKDENELLEILNNNEAEFYSQEPVVETVIKYAVIEDEKFLDDFDRCNPELTPLETDMKMSFIYEAEHDDNGVRVDKSKSHDDLLSEEMELESISNKIKEVLH
jgi:hypothetical protein